MRRKTKEDFKEKECKVIRYDNSTKSLDINFDGYGIRIRNVKFSYNNDVIVNVKYKGEIGNPVHRGTRDKLRRVGISTDGKTAVQLKKSDYLKYDYLIGMDTWNIRNMQRMLGGDPEGKIYKLLTFANSERDVADPWYTGDFEATYQDVMAGCKGLMRHLGFE